MKWILIYLKGTIYIGIMCWRDNNGREIARYADDLDKCKSLAEDVFIPTGGAVSWKAFL